MKEISIPNFRLFTYILLFLLAGVFLAGYIVEYFSQLILAAVVVLIFQLGTAILMNRKMFWLIIIFTFSLIAGILIFSLKNESLSSLPVEYDAVKDYQLEVISYPEGELTRQSFFAKAKDGTVVYISTSRYPIYNYGDQIKISGELRKPANISDFDWVSYLKRHGAVAEARNPEIVKLQESGGNKFLKWLYSVRRGFETIVNRALPEPESSLAIGLLIGSKQGFSDQLLEDFSRVGITHIIALSGFNITILIVFFSSLLLGRLDRKLIFGLSITLISAFVLMTGAAPSVIRASIITLLITFGRTIGRRADMVNLILLSAGLMVIFNPFILRHDLGFQLSFLAFIGLVYFSPILAKVFQKKRFKFLPSIIKEPLIETFSAQVLVVPLILSSFGLVSLISPLANIIILPIIPDLMGVIFISSVAYLIFPVFGQLIFHLAYLPLKYIVWVATTFSDFKLSALIISPAWHYLIVILYFILLILIVFLNRRTYAKELI